MMEAEAEKGLIQVNIPREAREPPVFMGRGKILATVSISQMLQLSVNGKIQSVEPGADLARLLQILELSGKRVAVERNGEIVPRSRYAGTRLSEGDALEIVVAVGGG